MIFNLIVRDSPQDTFTIPEKENQKTISLLSFRSNATGDNPPILHNIHTLISQAHLSPSKEVIDFVNLSLSVYVADQLVSRELYGHYSWGRYFRLYIPVADREKWESVKKSLENIFSFLSGDHWEIYLRQHEFNHEHIREKNETEVVSLFSGGLDSFIGAVDTLEENNTIALVSHHKGGGSGEKSYQELLVNKLKEHYAHKKILPFYFYVQPNQHNNTFGGEDTQRARSILFIALGLLVANALGDQIPLIIPENGLISLNVPLTKSRYGSHSTKTTHPHLLSQLQTILPEIGINNTLENPYRFRTKGEMVVQSRNSVFIMQNAYDTISCAKPGYYTRWNGRPEKHCGHCVPCIIRRSAMYRAGIDRFEGNYVHDVLQQQTFEDVKAFKLGLKKFISENRNKLFDLLKAGPLPSESISEYKYVYERGMQEVHSFLYQNNNP